MREMSKFPALIYLNNYILINDIWDFLLLFNAKNKAEANLVNPLTTKAESYSDLPEIFTTNSSNFLKNKMFLHEFFWEDSF